MCSWGVSFGSSVNEKFDLTGKQLKSHTIYIRNSSFYGTGAADKYLNIHRVV